MTERFVEWDRDRLVVVQGRPSDTGAVLDLVRVIERADASGDTLAAVDQLKTIFPVTGERRRHSVAVVFPRHSVTIHRIQLPQVPDAEIPDILRMQAAMRLTVPIESVCMDFTPLPVQPGNATRDVLLVTIPAEQVAVARRTLHDAGLELSEVRVSAWCIAQAMARAGLLSETSDAGTVEIIASLRRGFIELTFVLGQTVLFSHSGSSWSTPDAIEKTLRSELVRAKMSASEVLGESRIGRIVLVGSPDVTSAVSDQIASRFEGATVERVDPSVRMIQGKIPEGIAAVELVSLAGAVTGERPAIAAVDLINPRKSPPKKDLRRLRILAGSLAAVLLLAAGYSWRQSQIRELQESFNAVNSENLKLRNLLSRGESEMQQAAKIDEWIMRDISWLDELSQLKSILPPTSRMFVSSMTMMPVQRNGVGTVTMLGYAKSEADINELARRLRLAGYGVDAFKPDFRASAVSSEYGVRVELKVSLPENRADVVNIESAAG